MHADHEQQRREVLDQCIAARQAWSEAPGRNLVLLFDGTGNILGNHADTNVVRLLRALRKDSADAPARPAQLVYYDPGVGTTNELPARSLAARVGANVRRLAGLALGSGAFQNVAEAYEFLINHYQDGDRIFLFGFSRGAFTARALGGMINMYGLMQATGMPLTRTLVSNYFAAAGGANRAGRTREDFAADILANFSLGRRPLIHFTGVWDSVETIGSGFMGGVTITNSPSLGHKRFVHVRHALALHEIRAKYAPRRYLDPAFTPEEAPYRSFDERWFRGAHSDVGGSYSRDGLSRITLKWMAREAVAAGLLLPEPHFEDGNSQTIMHDQTYESPYWAWTGLNSRERKPSDIIDPSALPVAAGVPAERAPRTATAVALGALMLPLFGVLLLLGPTLTGSEPGCVVPGHPWLAWLPLAYELLAPWHAALGMACDAHALAVKPAWDWTLLAVFALWLAYPVTWAVRPLARRAIASGSQLPWLARHAGWPMRIALGAGALSILASYRIERWAWVVAGAALAELIALLMLLVIVLTGARARMAPR